MASGDCGGNQNWTAGYILVDADELQKMKDRVVTAEADAVRWQSIARDWSQLAVELLRQVIDTK